MPKDEGSPSGCTEMRDPVEPSASPDIDLQAVRRVERAPDVDVRALGLRGPVRDIDAEALGRRATQVEFPSGSRRRRLVTGVAALVLASTAGGGVWWNRQVTAEPRLEFSGGLNVYRDPGATDLSGIERRLNRTSSWDNDEVEVAFVPNSRLYAMVGLYNGGAHDVRIEAAPPETMHFWRFDGMSLSTDPGRYTGNWAPSRPFTLGRGETHQVRLEFRLDGCSPVPFPPRSYSVLREVRLRYRILGFTRTANVRFSNEAVAVEAPGQCAMPID